MPSLHMAETCPNLTIHPKLNPLRLMSGPFHYSSVSFLMMLAEAIPLADIIRLKKQMAVFAVILKFLRER